jgi:hypothetical protein
MDRHGVRLILDDQACIWGQPTLEVVEPFPNSFRVRDMLAPGLEAMVPENGPDGNPVKALGHVITAATRDDHTGVPLCDVDQQASRPIPQMCPTRLVSNGSQGAVVVERQHDVR